MLSLDLGERSFRFHDTVRHFLQKREGKEALAALHKTLLSAMEGLDAPGPDEALRRDHYLYRPVHLAAAGEQRLRSMRFLPIRPGCKPSSMRSAALKP